MKKPDDKDQIQPQPNAGEPAIRAGGSANSANIEDTLQSSKKQQRTMTAGTLFGGLVGLPMGAVTGAAICWLTGLFEVVWRGALIGSLAGASVGILIGLKERKSRGDLVRPDIATFVCVVLGLVPAALILLQGVGGIKGKATAYLLLGAIFAGPTVGLLIGAILDRAFEAWLEESWLTALAFAGVGVAVCTGLVCLIDAGCYGPNPEEVASEARWILTEDWKENPDLRGAKILKVTLARKGHRTYTGFADATIRGQPEHLMLEVVHDGAMISVQWNPVNHKAEE